MSMTVHIDATTGNAVMDLALDTLKKKKQALIFVNARNSAEKTAEDIAKQLFVNPQCKLLAEKILKAVETPTKQCHRLANRSREKHCVSS